jgi:hypothetical protein
MKLRELTLKNGTTKIGYWNGKVYGYGEKKTIYFNESSDGTKEGINWKNAGKYDRADVISILTIEEKIEEKQTSNIKTNNKKSTPVKHTLCPRCGSYCYGDCYGS